MELDDILKKVVSQLTIREIAKGLKYGEVDA